MQALFCKNCGDKNWINSVLLSLMTPPKNEAVIPECRKQDGKVSVTSRLRENNDKRGSQELGKVVCGGIS